MDNRGVAGWARSLDLLRDLDSDWTEAYSNLTVNPWLSGTLQAKEYQLIAVGLSAAITHLDGSALRRHIWSALRAGATQAEILEVLKMAAIVALHSMTLGAPILIEEAAAAGKTLGTTKEFATPSCDKMKAMGDWNDTWDSFFDLDPSWTDAFVSAGTGFYTSGVLTPKFVELMSIAFDAAISHMYAPGVRRHVRAALALGATPEEIITVLKLCVSQGADALYLGVPILAEEAAHFESSKAS
jgi:alkylhydroperoxidase/carboxymuconolactone decarboxylase family protein YurZ